jgi:hypothetical protein
MGKHKQVECRICFKPMRSNNVKGHMKVHGKYNQPEKYGVKLQSNEDMCREPDLVENVVGKFDEPSTSRNDCYGVEKTGFITTEALREAGRRMTQEYRDKIRLGEELYKILGEGELEEEAFSCEWKAALDFYIKQKPRTDYTNITLRPWQEELLEHISNPSDREIIWVLGGKCGEGKSWFQEYVQSLYGFKRVVAGMNIKVKTASLAHALQKRPLATTDIFMFNIGKSKTKYEKVNYELLEHIKDGRVFASKYNSQEIKFKTPNTVVVFSNNAPNMNELARDRWKIFSIESNILEERQISEFSSSNKNQSDGLKKKKVPDSDTDSDRDIDSDTY